MKNHDETSFAYMLRLASPMIMMTISLTVMQFIDRAMVSRLGTEQLAAVLPAGMTSFAPASLALGVITCLGTFVSQSLGKREYKDCSNYTWQMIYMGLAYLAVVTLILWPSARLIFTIMAQPAEVIPFQVTYFRFILIAHLLAIFCWCGSRFAMGIHKPHIVMWSAFIAHAINILLNYTLIFGHFGFPAMGIAGAGLGSALGVLVQAAIMMAWFMSGYRNTKFSSRNALSLDFKKMAELLIVGWPAGLAFTVRVTFFGIILFGLVGQFGKEPLAATSAVFSCIGLSAMPVVGLGIALTAAVGKSIGMGRKDLAINQTRVCLLMGLLYMGLTGLVFFVFRQSIMQFWSSDAAVISTGTKILVWAAIFQMFDAAGIIYTGALRGAGDTMWIAGSAIFGAVVVLGVGGYTLIKLVPSLGAIGPWIALTANLFTVGVANRWRFNTNHWQRINIFKKTDAAPISQPYNRELS